MKFKFLSVLFCSAVLVSCGVASNGNEISGIETSDSEFASLMNSEETEYFGLRAQKAAEKKIEAANIVAARKKNIEKALEDLRAVKALPNKGLMQAHAKCNKISEAIQFLKSTNSPKRPFAGMRQKFRRSLRAERNEVLKVNEVKSCGAVKKLVASLPPAAPEPAAVADEAVPAVDVIDPEVTQSTLTGAL